MTVILAALTFAQASPTLTRSAPLEVGARAEFMVDSAAPNARVEFFFSVGGEGAGPCAGATCLGVLPPYGRLHARANQNGQAALTFTVPNMQGVRVCAQAASPVAGTWETSNVMCFTVLPAGAGAMYMMGHDYWLAPFTDYASAVAQCSAVGLAPVVINDDTENAFIASVAASMGTDVWLGVDDIDVEGSFVDWFGNPAPYFNWNVGEPNNINDEDCVEIYVDGVWNDIACNTQNFTVCESY